VEVVAEARERVEAQERAEAPAEVALAAGLRPEALAGAARVAAPRLGETQPPGRAPWRAGRAPQLMDQVLSDTKVCRTSAFKIPSSLVGPLPRATNADLGGCRRFLRALAFARNGRGRAATNFEDSLR
jgi:hypothetical protein